MPCTPVNSIVACTSSSRQPYALYHKASHIAEGCMVHLLGSSEGPLQVPGLGVLPSPLSYWFLVGNIWKSNLEGLCRDCISLFATKNR